jgi:hypothetical protein
MNRFHFAPWRTYKAIVLVPVIAVPIIIYNQTTNQNTGKPFNAFLIVWLVGWFLVLFGDGSSGDVFTSSLRSYFVLIGIGILIYSLLQASIFY